MSELESPGTPNDSASDSLVQSGIVGRAWEEYKLLTDVVLRFDTILFAVKSWSITTCGILLSVYFKEGGGASHAFVLYIHILLTFFFWALDFTYKRFQSFQITRCRLLAVFLNNPAGFSRYRVPDNLMLNDYDSPQEVEIIRARGFYRTASGPYVPRRFDAYLLLRPQTSLIYVAQVVVSILVIASS